jgi:hypothetical protein
VRKIKYLQTIMHLSGTAAAPTKHPKIAFSSFFVRRTRNEQTESSGDY